MTGEFVAPVRRSVRWTQLGRSVGLLTLSSVALALPFSHALLLAPALAALALALSPLVAWASLAALRARVVQPRTAFVGESFEFELELAQGAAAVRLRDALVVPGGQRSLRSRVLALVGEVGRRTVERVPCTWRFVRRGRHRRLTLALVSTQPFGLFEARAELELPIDWLALPWLGSMRRVEEPQRARRSQRQTARVGRGEEEFYALREGRAGDPLHLVHWRSTARRSKLVVRELRGEELPPIEITLVGWVPSAPAGDVPHTGFERAVAVAATLTEHFVRRSKLVRFQFAGERPWSFALRPTSRSWLALMARLAEVSPSVAGAPAALPESGIVVGWRLARAASRAERWCIDVSTPEAHLYYSHARRRAEAAGALS